MLARRCRQPRDGADRRRGRAGRLRRRAARPRAVPATKRVGRVQKPARSEIPRRAAAPADLDVGRSRRRRRVDAGVPALPRERLRSRDRSAECVGADRRLRRPNRMPLKSQYHS